MSDFLQQLQATSPWETFAAALGLLYLVLAVKRSLWCWLCAFISTTIYLAIFARAALYMQSLLQVFYLAMAVYGFVDWRKGRSGSGEVLIESWTLRQHALAAVAVAILTVLNGWLLATYTDAASAYLDSFVTWGSVITTWMVARRVIENWLYWVVVDGLAAYLYFSQHLYPTTLLFLVYLGIVIYGYFAWRRERLSQQEAGDVAG